MRKLILILLLCPLFTVSCYAEGIYEQAGESLGVYEIENALPKGLRSVPGELDVAGGYDSRGAVERLVQSLLDSVKQQISSVWDTAARIMAITILCAVAAILCPDKNMQGYISLSGCACCALIVAGGTEGVVNMAAQSLTQLSDYSKAAMPVLFTAAAATGYAVSSGAKYAAVCISIDIMMSIAQKLIIPLVYAFLALSVADSFMTNPVVKTGARLIKWLTTTVLTGSTALFSTYIAITGIITASTDAVAVKTAKTVISSVLPVVGGIVADASGIVLSAASVIKNSAGAFALVAVCALCVGPFAVLSVKMLFFRMAAAVAGMLPDGRISGLLNSVSTAMSLLLGLMGSCAVMLFISIFAGIKVVV